MLLRRVADIDSSLLITGESGVGKEVAAQVCSPDFDTRR